MRTGAGEAKAAGLRYGRQRLFGARAAESSSVRARSCRVSWLVMAVAVATAAAKVTQGCGRKGENKVILKYPSHILL